VLSDGKDTSGEPDDALVAELEALDVRVDVVGLQQGEEQLAQLGALAEAGGGSVIDAADPAGLTALFTERAAALADELVVSFPVPADWEGGDGTVSVSVPVDGTTVTDQAFVSVPASSSLASTDAGTLVPQPAAASAGLTVSKPYMLAGVVGIGLAIIIMVASFANTNTAEKETVADRLKMYTGRHGPGAAAGGPGGAQGVAGVRQQALDLSERALSTGGLEIRIAARLEAAGMKLNSPEWLLMHFGIAVGAPLLAFLLTGGSVIFAVLALVAGILGPWYYLGRRRKRQLKRFGSQLPETLQLISGSLSAGLSFNQALDTVVREGTDPMAAEFRRALVEARLGVNMQDALNGIAERMASDDFAWVVMAVKIQREVGGNLAELLMTVAATLREREYLRRQVQTLSAEGRLSAWILGGMPPVFVGYLALVQPTYLAPMITTTLGWLMVGFASVLMVVGVVWLMKCVKVEI
jgi:tight adherence protein B